MRRPIDTGRPPRAAETCHPSGAIRPRYFDRQVMRAADLTLEQGYQDDRARRMARYLHGWGVVCGFDLRASGTRLVVGAGYALSPLGDEILLPGATALDDVPALAAAAGCGCDDGDCDDVRPGSDRPDTGRDDPVITYLVARPVARPSDPLAALPEGCGHPGNATHYSRDCHEVCLEIVCELSPPHLPERADCERLRALICRPPAERPVLPMPTDVPASANYVVLAALRLSDGQITGVSLAPQRRLMPVEVLQNWLTCLCDRQDEPTEPTGPRPPDPGPIDPGPFDPGPFDPFPDDPVIVDPGRPRPPGGVDPFVIDPDRPIVETPVPPRDPRPGDPMPADPGLVPPVDAGPIITGPGGRPGVAGRAPGAVVTPLEDVRGIGERRSAVLTEAGIADARALAETPPARVADLLRVSPGMAEDMIANARDLTGAGNAGRG